MTAAPTFTIANGKSITCHLCGLTSHNRHDVEHRYCGGCHRFHQDPSLDFDCSDCGRPVHQIAGPVTGTCGACTIHPGWFRDPLMAHAIDPGNLRRVPSVH